jgi:hypothetical protein
MKYLITNIFFAVVLVSIEPFTQERVNPQNSSVTLNNFENILELHPNNAGYIILSSGNYVCGEFGSNNLLYVIRDDTLFTLDLNTLDETLIGEITGINPGQMITTIGYSFNSETMFLGTTSIGTSELYNLNLNTATDDFIGTIGQPGLMTLDVDCSGNIYSIDIIDDNLWEINPVTGLGNSVGPIGFDANYSSHLDFDLQISTLYLVAFNNSTFSEQLRTVDLTTGATTLITDLGGIQVTVFAIEGDCGPGQASNPSPQDSSINIPITLNELTWENPVDAISNELLWGTDPDSLILVLSGGLFDSYSIPETLQYAQTYFWRVDEMGANGNSLGNIWTFTTQDDPTSITENNSNELKFSLEQNYPNPFNPSTKIWFVIPNGVRNLKDFSSQAPRNDNSFITLKVYDVLGNEIATLVNEEKPAGEYEVEFNATGLPSGIYFYKLSAGEYNQTQKMIYLK